ncbi:MAG TPA: hypothetical protein VHI76_02040 [Solirubrobacterales bacterium]|nr:hypothetical protein [Solirubrobacterales bacterium]
MLGTLASTLLLCGAALLIGHAVLVACGWRWWSWIAPVVGFGPLLAIAWGAVQLPGEGLTALGTIGAACAASAVVVVAARLEGVPAAVREGLPAAIATLALAAIPFLAEGRFGILGTGFNVDMSQHLLAADWLADPVSSTPGLVKQGYPLGPHGLAVAASELAGGNLVHGFDGLTLAVPVMAALASLAILRELPPVRRAAGAALVALPYVVASYLAQGQFKELIQGLFLLGFALTLHELARGWGTGGPPRRHLLAGVPLAAIALGSLYSYSAPGLTWLAAAAVLFAAAELVRRRSEGARAVAARAVAPVAVGLAVLAIGSAPELGRVADFQGNAINVASGNDHSDPPFDRPDRAANEDRGGDPGEEGERRHDNDLGNLFNEISPVEALGVWPSGDFRVDPGDGAVPAVVFYAGILLGALALAVALVRWLRRGETAVPAALLASVIVWAAAAIAATPYTAAKAVMMIAPLAMLVSARELLAPDVLTTAPAGWRGRALAALAAAFVAAAGISSLLALGNAPVGPDEYSPGLSRMRSIFEGESTLVLADPGALRTENARDFLAWEARGGDPVCIEPTVADPGSPPPAGIRYVVTTEGDREPPFAGLTETRANGPYTVWEVRGRVRDDPPEGERGNPSECGLALAG